MPINGNSITNVKLHDLTPPISFIWPELRTRLENRFKAWLVHGCREPAEVQLRITTAA